METIRSSREIEELFRRGRRLSNPFLMMLLVPTPQDRANAGRVAFIAGKKIGGAVVRNRARRLLREAARGAGAPWPGYDVALIARAPLTAASLRDVETALVSLLQRARLRA